MQLTDALLLNVITVHPCAHDNMGTRTKVTEPIMIVMQNNHSLKLFYMI